MRIHGARHIPKPLALPPFDLSAYEDDTIPCSGDVDRFPALSPPRFFLSSPTHAPQLATASAMPVEYPSFRDSNSFGAQQVSLELLFGLTKDGGSSSPERRDGTFLRKERWDEGSWHQLQELEFATTQTQAACIRARGMRRLRRAAWRIIHGLVGVYPEADWMVTVHAWSAWCGDRPIHEPAYIHGAADGLNWLLPLGWSKTRVPRSWL